MATAPATSTDSGLEIEAIRAEFPILERRVHGQQLAYLDNGATAQKPTVVIEALDRFWREHNANVHRGVHTLSEEATALYEGARATIARHLGTDPREVVFTRNVTGGLNLVAQAWGRANVGAAGPDRADRDGAPFERRALVPPGPAGWRGARLGAR